MRVASKINLAILTTFVFALILIMGNLFILSEQFKALDRTEKANSITRLSNSLLVLTQEFVLFKSPSVAESWNGARAELEMVLADNLNLHDRPQELLDIQSSLAELTPIFSELSTSELARNIDPEFQARRESLIVERLIAETQVISELGYKWSSQANEVQKTSLRSLTLLGALGLLSFVLVIVLLVVMMRSGILVPLSKLKRTADAIRSGYEDTVCDIDTSDELGDVARAVNQMAHNLAHKNKRLREANARVELASQAKTDFLSNMSHEIRTPLNGIVGLTYLLKDTSVSNNQKLLLESLEKTSRNLIDLVSDVLDISKIEAGSMALESKPFSMMEFIDKVSGIMTGAAASKPIELIIDVAPDVPTEMIGDELRFRQIVVNLVGNAIKFTQVGHVHLSISMVARQDQTCRLRVQVKDSGIGISPDGKANLFQQFQQADTSVAREFGGSGLGLNLVKKLVELMKGTLGFDSELGYGSVFWAELEFDIGLSQSAALPKKDSVLFVSESDMQARAMTHAGAWSGREIKVLGSLDQASKWIQDGGKPGGILLDFPRSTIDRQAWLEFVNSMSQRGIPCAVLVNSSDTRRLLDKGISEIFSSVFVKPLTPQQLQNAFVQSGENTPVRLAPLPGEKSKLNLLIVDDSELNLRVLEGILIRKQANITKANNGLEALSYLLQFGHGFDAVVMDVQMPLMDGLEATREIRRQPFNADLPVIGLTGEVEPEDEKRALAAGMNVVLHKPLQPDDLMIVLKKLIRQKAA